MARCVARAGFELTVCDFSAEARAGLAEVAAHVTDRVADCAHQDMTIIMVANDEQVHEVMLGEDGVLSTVDPERPPAIAVMSTVLPQTIEAVATACAKKGTRLIDAPVSGLPVVAEQGKLTIMVGGDPADLELIAASLVGHGGEHLPYRSSRIW